MFVCAPAPAAVTTIIRSVTDVWTPEERQISNEWVQPLPKLKIPKTIQTPIAAVPRPDIDSSLSYNPSADAHKAGIAKAVTSQAKLFARADFESLKVPIKLSQVADQELWLKEMDIDFILNKGKLANEDENSFGVDEDGDNEVKSINKPALAENRKTVAQRNREQRAKDAAVEARFRKERTKEENEVFRVRSLKKEASLH